MKKVFLFLTTLISLSALTIDGSAQIDRGELGSLTTVKDGLRSRRISSADKTGNNGDCVGQFKPGEKWSVEIPGTGVINHIWFTIAPTSIMRNDLIFRIYWDGTQTAIKEMARQGARESIVMLENKDNILPLAEVCRLRLL